MSDPLVSLKDIKKMWGDDIVNHPAMKKYPQLMKEIEDEKIQSLFEFEEMKQL